jgi:hypothetical protein
MHACMYDCMKRSANQRHTRHHRSSKHSKGVRVISAYVRASVLTVSETTSVHAYKSGLTKNIRSYALVKRLCFHRKKRKEISTHACTCTCACMCPPQLTRISRVCLQACTTCVSLCAATISLIHPLCASVCLYMYVCVS